MRLTLTLLITTALYAQPKTITTAERIALGALVERARALAEQQKEVERQYTAVVDEACTRLYGAGEKCRIQQDGTLAKVEAKEEAKK